MLALKNLSVHLNDKNPVLYFKAFPNAPRHTLLVSHNFTKLAWPTLSRDRCF